MSDSGFDKAEFVPCSSCMSVPNQTFGYCGSCIQNKHTIEWLKAQQPAARPSWDVTDQWEGKYESGTEIICVVTNGLGFYVSMHANGYEIHDRHGCSTIKGFNLIPRNQSPPAPVPRLLTPGELPFRFVAKVDNGHVFSFEQRTTEWIKVASERKWLWTPEAPGLTINEYKTATLDWRHFLTTKPLPEGG